MVADSIERLRGAVRDVPNFPKHGVIFKDITPILVDADLFRASIDCFLERCRSLAVEKVVGIDARGFLFGSAVAYALGVGFVPIRKKGKLPFKTASAAYSLEYGDAEVEMHVDSIRTWRTRSCSSTISWRPVAPRRRRQRSFAKPAATCSKRSF